MIGADAVVGTFAGLAEGATVSVAGNTYQISYVGGTGNDVVLTATVATCNNVAIASGIQTLRNQQVTVPVTVDSLTGRGILNFTYTLTYNSAVVSYIGLEQCGIDKRWNVVHGQQHGTGNTDDRCVRNGSACWFGCSYEPQFQATGPIGNTSPLTFTSFEFNEGVPCVSTTNGSIVVISSTISGVVTYANAPTTRPVPNTP